ncbi:hypothetical protein [Roseibium algae]|uniref:Uncharacterized protein n=1 Tax=Roseibium algae TaxID=3123038 RepID=A0ABU8TNL3_9HYPH
MTNLISANFKAPSAKSRLKRLALATTAAIIAVQLPFAIPALADTDSGETQHIGTPLDLPITLSGSYLAGRLAGMRNDFPYASAFFSGGPRC